MYGKSELNFVARQERKQHKHTTNTHYAHEDDKIDISKLNQIKLN